MHFVAHGCVEESVQSDACTSIIGDTHRYSDQETQNGFRAFHFDFIVLAALAH